MFLLILGVPGHSQTTWKAPNCPFYIGNAHDTLIIDQEPQKCRSQAISTKYIEPLKSVAQQHSMLTQLLVQMLPTNCMWKQKLFSMSKKSEWESERVFQVTSF